MHERADSLEEALAFVRLSNFAGAFARPAPKRICPLDSRSQAVKLRAAKSGIPDIAVVNFAVARVNGRFFRRVAAWFSTAS